MPSPPPQLLLLLLAPDTLVTLAMSVKNRCAMDKDNRSSFFPDVDQSNTETEYQVALHRVSSDVGCDGASEPETTTMVFDLESDPLNFGCLVWCQFAFYYYF
jgi:hypothetical protein